MPPSPLAGLETLADVSKSAVILAQGLRQRGQTFSTPREGSAVSSREVYFFASLHCFASMHGGEKKGLEKRKTQYGG